MKIKYLIVILIATVLIEFGLKEYLISFNKGVENLDFLTQLEIDVVSELNHARTDPAGFAEYLVEFRKFFVGNYIQIPGKDLIITKEGASAVNEAIEFLRTAKPVPPLAISRGISLAAKSHVTDQGSEGLISHRGTDGSSPPDRMNRFGKLEGAWGECIDFGSNTARRIVMQLIIDDGVKDRGHRKTIFNPQFNIIGTAFGPHSGFGSMCVIDFAAGFTEKDI
jgi:hypothetical protein